MCLVGKLLSLIPERFPLVESHLNVYFLHEEQPLQLGWSLHSVKGSIPVPRQVVVLRKSQVKAKIKNALRSFSGDPRMIMLKLSMS